MAEMTMRERAIEAIRAVPLEHGYDICRMLRPAEIEAIVDAVLAAMMEPTEEMIEAAHDRLAGDGDVADVYRAMIEAAQRLPIQKVPILDRVPE